MGSVPPDDCEDFPGRLLHQAALWDNAELLEDLLNGEHIKHLNCQDSWGRTPLHAAATTEASQCLRILLQAGGNPNIPCGPRGDSRIPLHIACEHGHIENVQLLVEFRADIMARDADGMTPLDVAEQGEHTACMEILRKAADEREQLRIEQHAALREACSKGETSKVRSILSDLGCDKEDVINLSPHGTNTVLFKACEDGQKEIVKILLENGGDGRIHPVTKYSPLYIACYSGRKDIAEMLLKKFPELVKVVTMEKWLPIHACTINGHISCLELLLKFPYPNHLMEKYRSKDETMEYEMAFDINKKDVTGQSVLYLACYLGNQKMVETLLRYQVKAFQLNSGNEEEVKVSKSEGEITGPQEITRSTVTSPRCRRISNSIQALMSRLHINIAAPITNSKSEMKICPVDVDLYCNNNTETALHISVKQRHLGIGGLLLSHGANANLRIFMPEEELSRAQQGEEYVFTGSTALVESCRHRDIPMLDLLLRSGARDDDCKALYVAAQCKDDLIMSKLLSLKAYQDPEFRINKKILDSIPVSQFSGLAMGGSSVTYSSLFPTIPTMINWHGQRCLETVREQWLLDASLSLNSKLKLNPRSQGIALLAITRLDISNNALTRLPSALFQLQSLRHLNAAQNKIERLPEGCPPWNLQQTASPKRRRKEVHRKEFRYNTYSAPVLEELNLQDNRLENIPEAIFSLPSLIHLDVSNNKLQSLPYAMWSAPKLKELNLAFNMLTTLPMGKMVEQELQRSVSGSLDEEYTTESSSTAGDEERVGFTPPAWTEEELTSLLSQGDIQEFPSLNYRHSHTAQLNAHDLKHHSLWHSNIQLADQIGPEAEDDGVERYSKLLNLNLAHNAFCSIPPRLSCHAISLARLTLSYNRLGELGCISEYPSGLRQLDVSHNRIHTWFTYKTEGIGCFCADTQPVKSPESKSGRKTTTGSRSVCSHRTHRRLEQLGTLVLADNRLSNVQLFTAEESSTGKEKVGKMFLFPSLSLLDVSNNLLWEVPAAIHELANLSVLNLAGNTEIVELPPEMGLLSRLWNLNTRGCKLQEPLRSMIDSNKYKTMDIIGYLKSVLEDARPYARMKLMLVGTQGIGKTSLLEQLRQEGTGTYKRKPPEHWAKRMGNKNINLKTAKGINISTVGVDIGDWSYENKIRGQSYHGPVVFRTWDFGGQQEYYATHQYFLSRRSLYLVVWRIVDGEKGVSGIMQWLVNIQARAPNAPVLIVGTHYDCMRDKYPPSWSEDLQRKIRERYISVVDADKLGLPRVIDTIEVSCKTRHNIRLLANLIYDAVFCLRSPGSKSRLLEQRVPATYLALEDYVVSLAAGFRQKGLDPVMTTDQFKQAVTEEMGSHYGLSFRDMSELNQATTFLHDNGILLHYEDATLKDLYFLDPQWLCDMLAHVITIREINPFVRNGVMRLDDMKLLFKSSSGATSDAQNYMVSLLNKFEVALTWDNRTLLLPSLLPTEELLRHGESGVRIPVRSRAWAVKCRGLSLKRSSGEMPPRTESPGGSTMEDICGAAEQLDRGPRIRHQGNPHISVRRLLLLSYFPSGWWPRLITRLLADDTPLDILRDYFTIPLKAYKEPEFAALLSKQAEWTCWQTGLELKYINTTLFLLREALPNVAPPSICPDYRGMSMKVKQEDMWTDIDIGESAILELVLPNETVVLVLNDDEESCVELHPNQEALAKLLALATDHIDTLLEDWYPSLGTRFAHTSEGKLLVSRLAPCPPCLVHHMREGARPLTPPHQQWDNIYTAAHDSVEAVHRRFQSRSVPRRSVESFASDGDSGVGGESPASSCRVSAEGAVEAGNKDSRHEDTDNYDPDDAFLYCFLVEECILTAYSDHSIECPNHGCLPLQQVAPDAMFLDIGERHLVMEDSIKKGSLLGRGAFGFVFRGSCRQRASGSQVEVALKYLQPVDPGCGSTQSTTSAYKAAINKWDRDPLQYACKAYCTARQELNILLSIRHPHIVPLVGLCRRPLALVLELAPLGSLHTLLRHYRRSGARLHATVLQITVKQVAKALEYLHQQHIIYRDLKAENVLAWEFPLPGGSPQSESPHLAVDVKIADYGISRTVLPTGTKGFGGTEGFMAPEILRYSGEEEYTQKVDCFSFGMLMYELLTLHQPFEGIDSVKDHILEGGRPPLTYKDVAYPMYILDMMVRCWSQHPKDRPSASQIVSIATAPEFTRLLDAIALNGSSFVNCGAVVPLQGSSEECELWLGRNSGPEVVGVGPQTWQDYHTLEQGSLEVTALTEVNNILWLGDATGHLYGLDLEMYEKLFCYTLDEDEGSIDVICSLEPSLQRVAVVTASRRLFLCSSSTSPPTKSRGEGSFVLTELGTAGRPIYAVATILTGLNSCELWCGHDEGMVSVFSLRDNMVTGQEMVNHFDSPMYMNDVLKVITANSASFHSSIDKKLWTYVNPGCVVYQWDCDKRKVEKKLDCSKLVPCSESIQSISIEEHLSPGRCQVTSLAVAGSYLYVGTTWGCVVVADSVSMHPITVFRPHQEDVSMILPLKQTDCIVTAGRGYRSLIERYAPSTYSSVLLEVATRRDMYVLLWKVTDWFT